MSFVVLRVCKALFPLSILTSHCWLLLRLILRQWNPLENLCVNDRQYMSEQRKKWGKIIIKQVKFNFVWIHHSFLNNFQHLNVAATEFTVVTDNSWSESCQFAGQIQQTSCMVEISDSHLQSRFVWMQLLLVTCSMMICVFYGFQEGANQDFNFVFNQESIDICVLKYLSYLATN